MAVGIVIDDNSVENSVGQKIPLPVRIKDGVTGNDINVATETTLEGVNENTKAPQGASSDGTVALASANTWYSVPSGTPPTTDYTLVVSLENADGTVRWSYNNGDTPSATNGNLAPNHIALNLGANKVV